MRRRALIVLVSIALTGSYFPGCRTAETRLYTFGIFQVTDAPTLNEARKGFIQALLDGGLREDVNVHLVQRNARGDVTEAQRIAQQFVDRKADMIVALSTQCLQAAIMAVPRVPIVFTSVANPYPPRRFDLKTVVLSGD